MKRAFVTGASGFIGAAVVRRLLNCGWQVAVLQRTAELGERLRAIAGNLQPIVASGGKVADFADAYRDWQPVAVFHLGWAGVSSVHRNDAGLRRRGRGTRLARGKPQKDSNRCHEANQTAQVDHLIYSQKYRSSALSLRAGFRDQATPAYSTSPAPRAASGLSPLALSYTRT